MTRLLTGLLTLLALGACLSLGAPSGASAASCPPVEVIGARGSGEPQDGYDGMGPEVDDFYASLRGLLGGGVVKGYGVVYPAANVESIAGVGAALHIGFLGKYTDSVREGTKDAEGRIRARHAKCPATKFVLAGYSQGAQAIGKVIENPSLQSLVAGAALFGDPYFNADSWSARGGDDPSAYGSLGVRGEWPASLHGKIFSYCHYHDVICNVSNRHSVPGGVVYVRNPADVSFPAHLTPAYELTEHGGHGDAGLAAREVARVLGFTPSPLPFTGPLDVAFAIDSTGSMADEIDEVKDNVTALVTQIAAIDPDYRLALVDYKDEPAEESAYQARVDTPFTTEIATFDRVVEALEAEGGGDLPESVYSGLLAALNLEWRPGAKKIVVQIGDAPAKDPEPITGLTLRAIQAKALSLDPATIDTIQTGEEPEVATSFTAIAAATGGQYLQLGETQLPNLVPAISEQIRRNTTAPAAVLTAPTRAVVGQTVTLSAGESHDVGEAIIGYDWDVNGDGVFDATTTDPVFQTIYPAPFAGPVTVRVRSASGLSSLATAPLTVGAVSTKAPGKPRHLRGKLDKHRLTLEWSAGKGEPPAWFTILDRKRSVVERVPVESAVKAGGYRVTIAPINPKRPYGFWVAAGGDGGESKPAGPVELKPRKHPRRHRRHPR